MSEQRHFLSPEWDETDCHCYISSEYFATGEGQSTCLYVSRCYALEDELDSFRERFGCFGEYPSVLSRSEFIRNYSSMIPPAVARFLKSEEILADFVWSCEFYVNAS
jgi:hypothetical protein